MRRSLTIIMALAVLLTAGAGCLPSGTSGGTAPAPVTLEYWRMDDGSAALDEVIANYQKTRPHVTVHVTTIPSSSYERVLLDAMAQKQGPDLFNVRNVDLKAWLGKLTPMPKETTVTTRAMGTDQRITWTAKKTPSLSLLELRNSYVAAVPQDVVRNFQVTAADGSVLNESRIVGLPFSMDTLALLYNQDLFRKASIQSPPQNWGDFQQVAARLTTRASGDGFAQSGSSLGGSANERYSADLLAEIMGQNGVDLTTDDAAIFNERSERSTSEDLPSIDALTFVQSFATEGTGAYTWNEKMPDSLDAFVQGRLAMFFGLPSDLKTIRERSPKMEVAVAAAPQINDAFKYNVALYPIEVVSKFSKNADTAWDFLQFAARAENVASFLAATGRPTALRSLIDGQTPDPDVGPFSQQALTAVTWYRGENYERAKEIMRGLVTFRLAGSDSDYGRAISGAAEDMTRSMRRLQ
jgi:ABC-type glycerol-3-phosphate transport system substrate-binding protein